MIVSPFTPLFFINRKADGIDSEYMQVFSSTDHILIQLIGTQGWSGSIIVYDEPDHILSHTVSTDTFILNSKDQVKVATLILDPGYYSVVISGIGASEIFKVTNDENELKNTTLIQYSMKDNRMRKDGLFLINGIRQFFDFRVHGGFKDSSWSFEVDNEQFITQNGDIEDLYSIETCIKDFTMGASSGCPIWYGELLNRIVGCTYVYFDGERYARKGNKAPEVSQVLEGNNSFVFTQTLQRVNKYEPSLNTDILLRRVNASDFRSIRFSLNRAIDLS